MTDNHLYPKCLGCELGLDHTWVDEDEWPMWVSKEGRQWRVITPGMAHIRGLGNLSMSSRSWPKDVAAEQLGRFPDQDPIELGHKREHTQWLWSHPHDCDLAWPERAVRRREEERFKRRAKSLRTTVEVALLMLAIPIVAVLAFMVMAGIAAGMDWLLSQL